MFIISCDSSIEPQNPGGVLSWAFIVRIMGKGEVCRYAKIARHGHPDNTNNQGEYLAVIAALLWLLDLPEENQQTVIIQSDSQLIVNHCSGKWECREPELKKLHALVMQAVHRYGKSVTFKWIPREKNDEADELSRSVYSTPAIQQEMKDIREASFKKDFGDDDISW